MIASQCPHCSTELTMTKLPDEGVAFLCKSCGGANIGLGLLKRKMDPEVIGKIWTAAGTEGKRGQNKCPTCPQPMTLITTKGAVSLELDICTNCYHIWFDRSELEKLPKNPHGTTPYPSGPVPSASGGYTSSIAPHSAPSLSKYDDGPDLVYIALQAIISYFSPF